MISILNGILYMAGHFLGFDHGVSIKKIKMKSPCQLFCHLAYIKDGVCDVIIGASFSCHHWFSRALIDD